MTLAALQTVLQDVTNTDIAEVILDSRLYFNIKREKQYPFVLWIMDNVPATKDRRDTVIQKDATITIAAFIVGYFNSQTDDRIATWDLLEGYFNEYINKVDTSSSVQVVNIDNMEGVYIHEGAESHDKELGIFFPKVVIKTFC